MDKFYRYYTKLKSQVLKIYGMIPFIWNSRADKRHDKWMERHIRIYIHTYIHTCYIHTYLHTSDHRLWKDEGSYMMGVSGLIIS